MTKKDFVKKLAEKTGCTVQQATTTMEAVISIASETLQEGDSIILRGFGTFKIINRAEKLARDIRRGKMVSVPAHREVKFIASDELKKSISNL